MAEKTFEQPRCTLHTVNGLLVPDFVTQENMDKLKDLELYPDDVWVVTYPKSGTTWTQQIVKLIRNNGVQDDVRITTAVPWPESSLFPFKMEDVTRPRAFKSHFPYDLLPCGPPHTTPCKYIFVARNPKDVAVSSYVQAELVLFHGMEWDAFWKKYITGDLYYGDYFDHLLSWLPHKDDKNVLFLKYEDMKRDLPGAVSTIASFMGADLSSEVVAKIADLTSFKNMKEDDTVNYSWSIFHQKEGAAKFLRKGIVGDWKNFLTAEQSAEIDSICAERLKDTGFIFRY